MRPPSSALDGDGTLYAFLFLGWIPPAVAAVVGGLIVAFATGNIFALVGVALVGTVVGYVACLAVLFTIGNLLAGRVGERVANGFLVLNVAFSVAAALAVAVAVAASGFKFDPVLFDAVVQAMTTVLGLILIAGMIVALALMRRSRS